MSSPISESDENKIIKLIETWPWPNKLTWERLITKIEKNIGLNLTRACISSRKYHPMIANAYSIRKQQLKDPNKEIVNPLLEEQRVLELRRNNLKNDISALTEEYLLALANINDRYTIIRREFFFGDAD